MIDYRRKDYTPSEIVLEMVKDSEKTPYAISKAAELNKNEVGRWMKVLLHRWIGLTGLLMPWVIR